MGIILMPRENSGIDISSNNNLSDFEYADGVVSIV